MWRKAPFFRGYLEANDPQAKALTRGGVNLPGTALYNFKVSDKKFERLPDEKLTDGKNYSVVESEYVDAAEKTTQIKYYFDPATYLLKQTVRGNAITQTETFDEYRKVSGINVAFASTITNPQMTLMSRITDLKFDISLEDSIFKFGESTPEKVSAVTKDESPKVAPPDALGEDALSESLRLETFERVWKTIDDSFYDRTFNNTDWRAVYDLYLPRVRATAETADFHKLLNRMVQELHLSHFKVIAPKNVVTLSSSPKSSESGSIGVSLKWIENQLLVSAVEDGSPAAIKGVRPGFIIKQINGKTPEQLFADYLRDNPGFQLRGELARTRAVAGEIAGKPDTEVSLEFTDADEKTLRLNVLRKGQPPGGQLEFEFRKLSKNVGYIKFNLFFGDLLPQFQTALQNLRDTKTLIIDLRGNRGGAGDLAPAMANLLCDSPGSLGSLKYLYETTEYSYAGLGREAYAGKLVLLTDEGTGSTAEVFAGGLQANRRALVVGTRSAGAVLPSLIALLPTGGALQYVVSNFQSPNGAMLEGRGITPDIVAQISRRGLLAGRDEILERAMKAALKK